MAAVDGLVSGLDTAGIVAQLMQLERQPQVRLQAQQTFVQKTVDQYRGINTLFLGLKTAADALSTGTAWAMSTATSSDTTRVAATATAGAATGSLTFTVNRLAAAGSSASSGTVTGAGTNVATAGSTIRLTKGTTVTDIVLGDGSLNDVVAKINDAKAGVTATAVQVSTGEYKLQLTSTTTGANTTIKLTDATLLEGNPFASSTLGSVGTVQAGADAELRVGGTNGYTVTRASNTVSDLMEGVTLTLLKTDTAASVTVDVKGNPEGTADAVQKMVDAANALLKDMKILTAYNPDKKTAGLMTGDGLMRGLQQRVLSTITGGTSATSPGLAGVSVTREGTVTFDRPKFLAAMAKDPAGTKATLGIGESTDRNVPPPAGVAERMRALSDDATRTKTSTRTEGFLVSAIKSREDEARGLTGRITAWDSRLELREAALRSKFAGLEIALGKMQQQQSWLAGQLAGLPQGGML